MLRALIFLLLVQFSSVHSLAGYAGQSASCPLDAAVLEETKGWSEESLRKVDALLQEEGFKSFLSDIKKTQKEQAFSQGPTSLYVFASFSLGEKALLNLALDAKHYGATLVLRGFRDGSLRKTAQSLHTTILKTGQGVVIDPELFTLFNITAVPTFVLAKPIPSLTLERNQTPLHDCLQGHVGLRYVLEAFTKEGDLKTEAKSLLARGAL